MLEKLQQLGLHARNCMQESRDLLHDASNTVEFLKVSAIDFEQRFGDCVPICDCVFKSDTVYQLNFMKFIHNFSPFLNKDLLNE